MAIFDFGFIATIRVVTISLGWHKIRLGVEVAKIHMSVLVILSVPATSTVPVPPVDVICLPELFLEESCDAIRNTLKFLIALSLGSLKPASNMTPDERH